MSIYNNCVCPVCKKQFEDGDDIVVCPECGTPHHRECYNSIHHCANADLHSEGYDFYKENIENKKSNNEKPSEKDEQGYYIPPVSFGTSIGAGNDPDPGIDNTPDMDPDDNGEPIFGSFQQPVQPIFTVKSPYQNDDETIDGQSVADIAITVRTNTQPFITKFKKMEKTKKKASWNWCAFIFGPYYYFFRKMYKPGVLYFCITLAINYATSFFTTKFAPETFKALADLMQNAYSGKSYDVNSLASAGDYSTAMKISFISLAVSLLIRIIFAVLSDYLYKNTVISIIKSVDEQLEDGASFVQTPIIMPIENLSEKEMRKMYLAKKGGISTWAPLLAAIVFEMILRYL